MTVHIIEETYNGLVFDFYFKAENVFLWQINHYLDGYEELTVFFNDAAENKDRLSFHFESDDKNLMLIKKLLHEGGCGEVFCKNIKTAKYTANLVVAKKRIEEEIENHHKECKKLVEKMTGSDKSCKEQEIKDFVKKMLDDAGLSVGN